MKNPVISTDCSPAFKSDATSCVARPPIIYKIEIFLKGIMLPVFSIYEKLNVVRQGFISNQLDYVET